MNSQFLSLMDGDIPDDKIANDMIPKINEFILEMNDVRKKIFDPALKKQLLGKLKLIIDVIEIYKDENLIKLIKEFKEEQEQKKRKLELINKNMEIENRNNNLSLFNMFNNNKDSSSDEEDRKSNISMDEFNQDVYDQMLDDAYDNIEKRSMLISRISVKRKYMTQIEDNVSEQIIENITLDSDNIPDTDNVKIDDIFL
jgi:hypothetical protein